MENEDGKREVREREDVGCSCLIQQALVSLLLSSFFHFFAVFLILFHHLLSLLHLSFSIYLSSSLLLKEVLYNFYQYNLK
jgi:hypothetical protein